MRKKKKRHIQKNIILIFLLSILIFFLITNWSFEVVEVKGDSMNSSIFDGDHLLLRKYNIGKDLSRSDIVSFKDKDSEDTYIKRIIGLPGDYVQLIEGKFYINGMYLKEEYIDDDLYTENLKGDSWQISRDEVFVVGDNRRPNMSLDSRYFGPIKIEKIKGIVQFRIYPFERIGDI